jgi:hypothetical protein
MTRTADSMSDKARHDGRACAVGGRTGKCPVLKRLRRRRDVMAAFIDQPTTRREKRSIMLPSRYVARASGPFQNEKAPTQGHASGLRSRELYKLVRRHLRTALIGACARIVAAAGA